MSQNRKIVPIISLILAVLVFLFGNNLYDRFFKAPPTSTTTSATTNDDNPITPPIIPNTDTTKEITTIDTPQYNDSCKLEIRNWDILVKGCFKNGNNIECDLVVTSKYRDRNFGINGSIRKWPSKIFDDFSNEYIASKVILGDKTMRMGVVEKKLIRNIPVNAKITFENIDTRATYIPLLELSIWADEFEGKQHHCRNLKIKNR